MKTRPQMLSLRALLLLTCLPATALAQAPADQAPPPPPPPPPEAPAQPEAPPVPPGETPPEAPATPATPSLEDRLTHVEGKLEGMEESSAATNATVDALKKIKVSGYIQSRYEWHDDASSGVDAANNNRPRGTNRFLVRRGRLKTLYQGHLAEYMLQIDATPDGVTLKDAEASLVLDETVFPSPTPFEVKLTVGQFKVPFGYELLQSSGDREMPERSTMIRTLFPGERDRGARLQAKYGPLRFAMAVINGNVFPNLTGSSDTGIYGSFDQSSFKDWAGRIGGDFGFLVVGGSIHYGHSLYTTLAKAASGMTAATPTTYLRFERLRLGADAQIYADVPALGGLVLRGELIYAPDKHMEFSGTAADPCKSIKSLGWYATVVQNIGDHFAVVFRADQFDKNGNIGDSCDAKIKDAAKIDKVTTLGGGFLVHVSGNLKATAIYEHVGEQGTNKKDNDVFTLQLQAKF